MKKNRIQFTTLLIILVFSSVGVSVSLASADQNGKAVILIDQSQYATNNPSFRTIEGTLDYFGYKYDILPYSGTISSQLNNYNMAFAISPDTSTRTNLILNYSQQTGRYVMVTDHPIDSYAAAYNLTFVSNVTVTRTYSDNVNSGNPIMNKIPGGVHYDKYTKYNLGTDVAYGLTTTSGDKLYLTSKKVVFINEPLDPTVHEFDPQLIRNFLSIADPNLTLIEGSCPYAQDLAILIRLDDFGGDFAQSTDYPTYIGAYLPWYNITHNCTIACIMSTATAQNISLISGADLEPHSYSHSMLTTMSQADELNNIMLSVSVFNSIFGVNPIGFIPPGDFFDGNTTKVLHDNGFRYCSVSAQQIGGIGMSYGYYFNPGDEGNDMWILGCTQQDPSDIYMPTWYFEYAGDRQFFLILDHPDNEYTARNNDVQLSKLRTLITRTTQTPGWYISTIKDYIGQLDNAKKAYVSGNSIIVSSPTSPGLTFYKQGLSSPIVIDGTTSTILLRTDKTELPALRTGIHTFTYSSVYPVITSFTNGQIITDSYYDIPSDSVHFSIRDTNQIYNKTSVSFAKLHSGSYTLKKGTADISQVTVNNTSTATFSNLIAGDYVLMASAGLNTSPSASFSMNASSGNPPLTVKFSDLSTGFPTSWSWDFGDGNTSNIENPVHTFVTVGNYTVNLTAVNGNGTNSTLATIKVLEQSAAVLPVANFSSNVTEGNAPLDVKFTDLSENATEWYWNFGDGTNSVQQNPTHIYSAAGNYTVNLTASNAKGTNSKLATITVKAVPQKPIADFSATPTSGTVPLNVSFTDRSTGTPTSWTWSFGDGNTSNTQNPAHKYNQPGIYTVGLTVQNAFETNTTTKINFINVAKLSLVADFSATPTKGKAPLRVQFTDRSTGTPTSTTWSFGDGTSSTVKNPAHTYIRRGIYNVRLTVKNNTGSNSVTKNGYITVSQK